MTGWRTAALLFLLALGLSIVIGYVHADDTNVTGLESVITNSTILNASLSLLTNSTVEVTGYTDITKPPAPATYRIDQGQAVYPNDTIDITGIGWGKGIAWYGRNGEFDLPEYVYTFTDYSPRGELTHFWIDPSIFSHRLGMWYQYYGNASEPNGNLAEFYVKEGYRNSTLTLSNGTVVNQSIEVHGNGTPLVIPQESWLPEIHDADYLLAIGDPLIVKTFGKGQVWIFGRVDMDYGSTQNDNMTFPASDFVNFEPGAYTMIVQHPGNNTQFDVRYDKGNLQYYDGWNGIQTVDISPLQPRMVIDKLESVINGTDDTYTVYTLEVQEPRIDITQMDEVWIGSKILEYHYNQTQTVLKDVRGYTNLQNGSTLAAVLDKDWVSGDGTVGRFTTTAEISRSAPGNRTMFRVYIPVVYDNLPTGMHTITITGPYQSTTKVDFPVELLPPDSFRPNTSLKYTSDENPWKPNLTIPTPIVVTVPGPTQIITVQVTPSNEQVAAQQKAALDAKVSEIVSGVGMGGAVIIAGFLFLRFIYRAWQRRKWHRK